MIKDQKKIDKFKAEYLELIDKDYYDKYITEFLVTNQDKLDVPSTEGGIIANYNDYLYHNGGLS